MAFESDGDDDDDGSDDTFQNPYKIDFTQGILDSARGKGKANFMDLRRGSTQLSSYNG